MSDDKQDLPELLTLAEAAEQLKVHPNTLRNWDKSGLLVAKRIGVRGLRRYAKEDLVKLLERNDDEQSENSKS
ncbi:helix-turn-helix domain-containing protein [Candidatus Berkelbacteria bacterium]|nr:helix-turn-helix domain-containing protein [Candidatus Berkelbacteria bacterium]